MRLATLLGPDIVAAFDDPEALTDALREFRPEDIAEIMEDLSERDAVRLMSLIPLELGADVLEQLSPPRQELVVTSVDQLRAAELLVEMDPDDRVDLVQELDEEDAEPILQKLETLRPGAAEEARTLAMWSSDTAGGLMTTEYVSLEPDTKVWQAIEHVRAAARTGDVETIYSIYVCFSSQLVGVVSLRDLILVDPGHELRDVMEEKVVRVAPEDDQERVAELIARYDLTAIPVVHDRDGMLGVVTVDDVVDVVIEEATEDAQKMGGVVPLEDSYFQTGLVEFVWKRGAWLVLLFLGQLLTASVMQRNEDVMRQTVELVLFIPLIIASGGNAGSQSSTLIIRAMAVGEVRPRDWMRVFVRELGIGVALGIALGLIGFARAWFEGETVSGIGLGAAVGTSILAIVVLSTIVGSLLPMGIKRLGLDPAVSSTPFIASVVDVLGLIVYFAVAQLILTAFL